MSLIQLRRPWTQQPQEPLGIDSGHPLAARVKFAYVASARRDVVGGRVPTVVSGAYAERATPAGIALASVGSVVSLDFGVHGTGAPSTGAGLAFMAVFREVSTATILPMVSIVSGGVGEASLAANGSYYGTTSAGELLLRKFNTPSVINRGSYADNVVDGAWHCAAGAFTSDAGGYLLSMDGRTLSRNDYEYSMTVLDASGTIRVGGLSADNGGVALAVIMFGGVTQAELNALTAAPWQLFEPQRIWVPVSAGGGGTSVGLAPETDAALALAAKQIAATGIATESDSAQALAALSLVAVGVAAESDAALALDASTPGVVGAASETDTALALVGAQIVPVGVAVESSASLALAAVQAITAGMALEIDAGMSLAGLQARGVGRSDEVDAALGLLPGGSGTGATAAEIWSYTLSSGLTAEATLVAIHTMLSELHLIHGLTAGSPLSVTAASRAAGAVSQAVAEAAGTVTVTRQ